MADVPNPTPPPGDPPPAAPPPSAETVTALSGRLREETEKRQAAEQRAARADHLEHTLAVFQATGLVDQELADLAIAHWDRLPKTDRPKLGDWAAQIKTAPPRWAQGYFGPAAAAGETNAASSKTETTTPAAQSSSSSSSSTPTGAGPLVLGTTIPAPTGGAGGAVPLASGAGAAPAINAQTMKALREEAKKTGDWSKVTAASAAAKKLK